MGGRSLIMANPSPYRKVSPVCLALCRGCYDVLKQVRGGQCAIREDAVRGERYPGYLRPASVPGRPLSDRAVRDDTGGGAGASAPAPGADRGGGGVGLGRRDREFEQRGPVPGRRALRSRPLRRSRRRLLRDDADVDRWGSDLRPRAVRRAKEGGQDRV